MNESAIRCPVCNCGHHQVYTTRHIVWKGVGRIKRYRRCRHCGNSFTTTELSDCTTFSTDGDYGTSHKRGIIDPTEDSQ